MNFTNEWIEEKILKKPSNKNYEDYPNQMKKELEIQAKKFDFEILSGVVLELFSITPPFRLTDSGRKPFFASIASASLSDSASIEPVVIPPLELIAL